MALTSSTQQSSKTSLSIGFRVECYDEASPWFNSTVNGGNVGSMAPRGAALFQGPDAWRRTVDANLSCDRQQGPTPFISFLNSWRAAMRWRERLIDQGATNVAVVAVWLHDKSHLHDAHAMTAWLGYVDNSADGQRRLEDHEGEVLLHGSISSDERIVLAHLAGDSTIVETISLRPLFFCDAGPTVQALVPRGTLGPQRRADDDKTEALKAEMHNLSEA